MPKKIIMPSRGRTGEIEIECDVDTIRVPKGPFRYTKGSKKGQFVPIKHVRRNFAALIENLARAEKAEARAQAKAEAKAAKEAAKADEAQS